MRQAGVLDVGCHSALLMVARRRPGTGLEPVFSHKVRLRLHETLDRKGRLDEAGMRSVERAVAQAVAADPRLRGSEVFAFATSVIRDAPNRDEVITRVARATGTRLRVVTGEEEARLAYLAARQWAAPPARQPLLMLDIGGGTVEIASGTADQPGEVYSLPLGARRITRDALPGGAATRGRLAEVRHHLDRALRAGPDLPQAEPGGRVLACSKTFEQLARLASAHSRTPKAARQLALPQVRAAISLLADTEPARRARLPGISRHRAEQSLAGALVAEALMEACGAGSVEICPWSTREGLLLERLGVPGTAAHRPRLAG